MKIREVNEDKKQFDFPKMGAKIQGLQHTLQESFPKRADSTLAENHF